MPWVWSSINKLTTATVVIRGRNSDTLSASAMTRLLRKQPHIKAIEVEGGHLFPLEQPAQTAAIIRQQLAGHEN